MHHTVCQFCQQILYTAYVENKRVYFEDTQLTKHHTKARCLSNQKFSYESSRSVQLITSRVDSLESDIKAIKERLNIE